MPSKSKAQQRLMAAVAHSPEFARKVGISQKVGREFEMADKKGLAKGGKVRGAKKPVAMVPTMPPAALPNMPTGMSKGPRRGAPVPYSKGGVVRGMGAALRGGRKG